MSELRDQPMMACEWWHHAMPRRAPRGSLCCGAGARLAHEPHARDDDVREDDRAHVEVRLPPQHDVHYEHRCLQIGVQRGHLIAPRPRALDLPVVQVLEVSDLHAHAGVPLQVLLLGVRARGAEVEPMRVSAFASAVLSVSVVFSAASRPILLEVARGEFSLRPLLGVRRERSTCAEGALHRRGAGSSASRRGNPWCRSW
mmetsp:Transcript_3186/g.9344  ORF Transcript_3186/g.9344 Transcript_3186/m.9344 type:complete len:200 (+) Transcript_3186:219-818(+)